MGGRQHNLAGKSYLLGDLRQQVSHLCARHQDGLENLLRISQQIDQLVIPVVGLRVDQLSCGRLGILLHLLSCQQEMEIVRNHQHGLRLCKVLGMLFLYCHQLIDRVENLLLNAGSGVEILGRDQLVNLLVHSLGAAVTVGHRIAQHLILLVQQHKVHTPGIDSQAGRNLVLFRALLHTVFDLGEKLLQIPAEVSVHIGHTVVKAVDLLENHLSVLHMAQNVPAAGGADVDSKIILHP